MSGLGLGQVRLGLKSRFIGVEKRYIDIRSTTSDPVLQILQTRAPCTKIILYLSYIFTQSYAHISKLCIAILSAFF